MAAPRRWGNAPVWVTSVLTVWLTIVAASPSEKSDPLCPHIIACKYEAPAFNIRIVEDKTGQPLAEVHAIATWVVYGGPRRRGLLMVLEAVSGPDGVLSFPSWGPIYAAVEGVMPGSDPMISVFRPGYRAQMIHNATPLDLTDTARVRAFDQNGATFRMRPVQDKPADILSELRKARDPFDGTMVSEYDPRAFQNIYLKRLRLVRSEVEGLPHRGPDYETLLWGLNADIHLFDGGGRR